MSRREDETSKAWFERAIVNHSGAAEQVGEMERGAVSVTSAAREAITNRASSMSEDLQDAQAAFTTERDTARAVI